MQLLKMILNNNSVGNTTIQRLKSFIEFNRISVNSVALRSGIPQGSLAGAINRDKGIGSDLVGRILNVYPELSSEWLLTGKGEMIKPSSDGLGNNNVSSSNVSTSNIGKENNRNIISISLPEQGNKKIIKPDGTIRIELESQKTNDLPDNMEQMYISRIADLEKLVKAYSEIIELLKK